jgi:DNA-binding CsgD family transcriptional regulator
VSGSVSGAGASADQVEPGDHICALYSGSHERNAVLAPFLHAGLAAGDKCVCIIEADDRSGLLDAIGAQPDGATGRHGAGDRPTTAPADVDVAACLASRQLELYAAADSLLRTGRFSPDDAIRFWDEGDLAALDAGGYRFVRNAGDTAGAVEMADVLGELTTYEVELDRFVAERTQAFLCLYDVDFFGGAAILELLRTHPKMLLGDEVVVNPYYLLPDDHIAGHRATGRGWAALTEIERVVAELAAGGASTAELADRLASPQSAIDRHLHRVYRKLSVRTRDELALAVTERRRRR